MMTNKDLIKLLVDLPMDAPVMSWGTDGIKPLTTIASADGVPDWQKEEANLPTNAIILPV
jgi:hypothetical protein